MTEPAFLKRAIEALLFVTDSPLRAEQIREATDAEYDAIRDSLERLREEFDSSGRGFRLKEIAGGFQFVTDPEMSETVRRFVQSKEKKRLSQASLETLSIIAYKQPLTRTEIEFIRGVNVDGAVKTLIEKGLIRIVGRKEVPGRPILYGTTREFLDHFGLPSLKGLPKLVEFTEKDIELPDSLKPSDESNAGAPVEAENPDEIS